jgi:hypothetical protein
MQRGLGFAQNSVMHRTAREDSVREEESGARRVMTCGPGRSVGEGGASVPLRLEPGWAVGWIRSWAESFPSAFLSFSLFFSFCFFVF